MLSNGCSPRRKPTKPSFGKGLNKKVKHLHAHRGTSTSHECHLICGRICSNAMAKENMDEAMVQETRLFSFWFSQISVGLLQACRGLAKAVVGKPNVEDSAL